MPFLSLLSLQREKGIVKNKLGANEKVLLRKTGNPIFACYDNSGIFPEQSLYFAFNKKTDNSLKCLSAFLNSNLFQFCIGTISLREAVYW